MQPDAGKYLWDVQRAAERIVRFTAGKSFEDYRSDELLRSAVERQFEIIGEALNQLRKLDAPTAERIPHLAQIIAFRNVLIHGYASVDDRLVWGVVEGQLADLVEVSSHLLGETDRD
jgi:uncharacterized protein with HEPN domain